MFKLKLPFNNKLAIVNVVSLGIKPTENETGRQTDGRITSFTLKLFMFKTFFSAH